MENNVINYDEELKKLRFSFRPEEIIDYQTLVTLIGNLLVDEKAYENNKEELFHTVQILVLVYGMEDQLDEIGYKFNPNNVNINDINLWKSLVVMIFNDLEKDSNFTISEKTSDTVLTILGNMAIPTEETVTPIPATIEKPQPVLSPVEIKNELDMTLDPTGKASNEILNSFNWTYLREYIIDNNLLPYKCSVCGLNEWQGKPLPLKLSHNSRHTDNNGLRNLRFLCPNCYSQIGN